MHENAIRLFLLTFATLMIWGCKKDNIVDDNGPHLTDSLAWNDSIGGQYMMYGFSHSSIGNVPHTDTIEKIMTVEIISDSNIVIQIQNSVYEYNMKNVSLNQDSSTYYLSQIGPGYSRYYLKFINNNVDSVYYTTTYSGLSSSAGSKLTGVRIP